MSTALSRATGFIRILAMAIALGASPAVTKTLGTASAFTISNNIPNMIYELLAGGVLSSMFIPIFMEKLAAEGREKAYRMTNTLYSMVLVILGAMAVLGTLFPEPFVFTQTLFTGNEGRQLAVYLFRFFAVQIVFYGWSAITTGVLNSNRRFFAPAIAPVANNVVVIASMGVYYFAARADRLDIATMALGVGTTLGVLALLLTQIPSLLKLGFRFRWSWDLSDPTLRKMLKKTLPILGYVAANLTAVSFRNSFASNVLGDGAGILAYAWNWYQLPYGVLAVAFITALFPELSEMAQRADWRAFKGSVSRGLRVMAVLIMPFAAMLASLSVPLTKLYQSHAFKPGAVPLVAGVLAVWALGLFSFCAFMFMLRSFYSQQDSLTPMFTNLALTVVQIGLYWAFTSVTAWGTWRLLGLPAGDAIFYSLHTVVLMVILRRRHGPLGVSRFVSTFLRVLLASAVGGVLAWGITQLTPGLTASRFGFLLQLIAGGAIGLAAAYGLVAVLRVEEIHEGFRMAKRAVGRLTGRTSG